VAQNTHRDRATCL